MKRFSGFTLIELLLVVAILAILTAVILPKFDGLQSKVNHGVGAASADDTSRLIVTYKVTKNKYPNGWDSLMVSDTGGFWTAADPTLPGVHTQLTGIPIAGSGPKLTTTTLTQGQVDSLARMGITKVFHLGGTASQLPGDRFNVQGTLSTSSVVAILNQGTAGGRKMIDSIYPKNLIVGSTPAGVSGATPSVSDPSGGPSANKILVVFGIGPKNDMIGTSMSEAPFYPNVDHTLVYNRNLVVFEVDPFGGRADFKGTFGADGDLKTDMALDMFK